jgi:hypothetical protein
MSSVTVDTYLPVLTFWNLTSPLRVFSSMLVTIHFEAFERGTKQKAVLRTKELPVGKAVGKPMCKAASSHLTVSMPLTCTCCLLSERQQN